MREDTGTVENVTREENEVVVLAPVGRGCMHCGGPVCTGYIGLNGKRREVFVCSWCKGVVEQDQL